MTAAMQLPLAIKARQTKREAIEEFFRENLGREIGSSGLHAFYGSSFRTRVSEINRDSSAQITIRNRVTFVNGAEQSVYWAERRP